MIEKFLRLRKLLLSGSLTKNQNMTKLRTRNCLQQKEAIAKAADEVISGEAHFRLPDKEWDAFCNALDSKPKDIHALRKLLLEPGIFDDK